MLAAQTRAVAVPVLPKPSLMWKQIAEEVEPFLQSVTNQLSDQVNEFEPKIAAYARYALHAQGKQLRPILVSLSGEAAGKLQDGHVTVATIIEMVHLATLVHDDVIDEAEIRRARPTLAADCGNEIAVLLGDCLFAQALKLAASFPTPEICRAVASSTKIVCSGEILQSRQRGDFNVSRDEYFRVLAMKTGELFALACDLGAHLADAKPGHREALREFGLSLGTAYQIYDDCVDLFGNEASTGKSLGTDLAKGKPTLPILIAMERATASERSQLQETIGQWKPEFLPRVLDLLAKYDAFEGSRSALQQFLANAQQQLLTLPANNGRAGLIHLSDYLMQQFGALETVS